MALPISLLHSSIRRRHRVRLRLAVLGGAGLAVVLAGQSLAMSWAAPVPLSASSGTFGGGIVRTGATSAAAVYDDGDIMVKRTLNAGNTWIGPVTLSTAGSWPRMAGIDADVDVVWVQGHRLRFARSGNSGVSFSPTAILSPSSDVIEDEIGVARGPDAQVAVVWLNNTNPDPFGTPDNRLRVRISTNGGSSFGSTKTLATGEVFGPAIAIGNGVIYLAYAEDQGPFLAKALKIRRSLDGGANWSAPVTLATNLFDFPILTAAGSHVYVSYSAQKASPSKHWARYVRSTNKGATWSSPINLAPKTGSPSWVANVELRGGVIRAAYMRCVNHCMASQVFYRESSNGTTWSPAEQVSIGGAENLPFGVTFAGKVLVGYDYTPSKGGFYAAVRSGTP